MPDVLFITPGPIEFASSRIRGHWIAEHIEGSDTIQYQQILDTRIVSSAYDHYIFIKSIDTYYARFLREEIGKKVWWDLCDPVHWFSPDNTRDIVKNVNGIVFSSEALRRDFVKWYGSEPIPMITIKDRLKIEHYKRYRQHSDTPKTRLIWFGASQNRISIYAAVTNLARLEANGVSVSVTFYDDAPHDTWRISQGIPTYHAQWSLDTENEVLTDHDIALLPPYPGPWGDVKSNNKTLTAWACGLPVSDGINYDHLYRLCNEAEYRKTSADIGYKTLISDYDVKQSAQEWKDFLDI